MIKEMRAEEMRKLTELESLTASFTKTELVVLLIFFVLFLLCISVHLYINLFYYFQILLI